MSDPTAISVDHLKMAPALLAIPLKVSRLVPDDGQVWVVKFGRTEVLAGPLTMFKLNHHGRLPFESRYSPGGIALERHRRTVKRFYRRNR